MTEIVPTKDDHAWTTVTLVEMVRRSWIQATFLKVELDGTMFVPVFMSLKNEWKEDRKL